ncbi:MAG: PadR family transcriptional regulator [Sneathiella sp.]|nr:PadR family transcriptional regulator [Sneathiella sp.]
MNVRTLCLGILTYGDASGYEIKKAFQERLSLVFDAGFGSIYPALNKLTEDGFVSCRAEAQSKRPDKKVYSITTEGQLKFLDDLQQQPAEDKFRSEALTTLLFAHLLQPRNVSELIDEIITNYEQNIDVLSKGCDIKRSHSEKFLCGFGVTVRKAAITYMQDNRHLVEAESLLSQNAAE